MSIEAMSIAWESELPATDRLVLLAIADHVGRNEKSYPSVSRLQSRTGLSVRSVQGAIKRLEALGYLAIGRQEGPHGTNTYKVKTPAADAPQQELHPAGAAPHPRRSCTPPPAGAAPEPSMNPQEPSNMSKSSSDIDADLFEEFWRECPRKVGKGNARPAFKRALKKASAGQIIEGMKRFARVSAGTEPRYVAHPATWLNGERWDDDLRPRPVSKQKSNGGQLSHIEWMRKVGRLG
ncbi:helix-turn-helix domain-containing protein [Sagittula sp. MA-2]|jgi:DNA-binding MarR family transcriptional regulator|uniref:helix-turn-helix domain-containing protein n=1 Tax=Sagittula sp. MA-2 TaxID=3048007 RepID=UPI0024C299F0|nr:helix-turn-helix domain-containing protein [Sagittula sp. MA-2]WHZ35741.1 helix-turn-helix domain-containing protein [Sagittula sp. MA-2]